MARLLAPCARIACLQYGLVDSLLRVSQQRTKVVAEKEAVALVYGVAWDGGTTQPSSRGCPAHPQEKGSEKGGFGCSLE
jgi:hypothetical protein